MAEGLPNREVVVSKEGIPEYSIRLPTRKSGKHGSNTFVNGKFKCCKFCLMVLVSGVVGAGLCGGVLYLLYHLQLLKDICQCENTFKVNATQWYAGDLNPCRTGWIFNASFFACYFIGNERKSWNDALRTCSNMSACLTNVISADEAMWIGQLTDDDVWVGGRLQGMQYFWKCERYSYKQTVPGDSLWAKEAKNIHQCIHLYKNPSFVLNDAICHEKRAFVCKNLPYAF